MQKVTPFILVRHCALLIEEAEALCQAMELVEEQTGVSPIDVLGGSRLKHIARARQMVMYEARKLGPSYPAIGRGLGRHHTTVIFGCRAEAQRRGEVCP